MGRDFTEEVVDAAGRMLPWYERIALALAVAILRVLARRAGKSVVAFVAGLQLEPQVYSDEFGPPRPGVDLPTDPDNPGGGPYGGGQG